MSDLERWQALKDGDKGALEHIYRDHAAVLLKYGRKFMPDAQLVEDCIQDLFIELWDARQRISATDSIRKYLFVSLRRKIVKTLDRQVKKIASEEPEERHFQADFGIDQLLIQNEMDAERESKLKVAMAALSERQREVLYLKYFADMDYNQIGEIMELNYQSARNLSHRALESLRQILLVIFIVWLCNFFGLI
jgi:RNA polymerase sigma-70 factor (ECF subfamily)